MPRWHSTYHFYGVHVPSEKYQTTHQMQETDFLGGVINHTPALKGTGLGYVTAGDYDRDELFLCVVPDDPTGIGIGIGIGLGSWKVVQSHSYAQDLPEWDRLLKALAEAAGYKGLDEPGWVTIPDCS